MDKPDETVQWIANAFETVINYIESDNESDMNQYVLDLIAILRDLQDKVRYEEIERGSIVKPETVLNYLGGG